MTPKDQFERALQTAELIKAHSPSGVEWRASIFDLSVGEVKEIAIAHKRPTHYTYPSTSGDISTSRMYVIISIGNVDIQVYSHLLKAEINVAG